MMIKKELEEDIIKTLKTIYDPEIPVDVYELGLIYEIKIDDYFNVETIMTLTSPNCPVAEILPQEIEDKIKFTKNVKSSKVTLTFDPQWSQDMMSEEAKFEMGFL